MIKPKIKKCKDCGQNKPIFAKGLCTWCYRAKKQKEYANKSKTKRKRKRIKPISEKQAELLAEYRKVRDKYMLEHPVCEAKTVKCQGQATDLHHLAGKKTRKLYLDPNNFMSVCRKCHEYIHEHPKESYEKGLLIKNH